jgi:hypothetical protein
MSVILAVYIPFNINHDLSQKKPNFHIFFFVQYWTCHSKSVHLFAYLSFIWYCWRGIFLHLHSMMNTLQEYSKPMKYISQVQYYHVQSTTKRWYPMSIPWLMQYWWQHSESVGEMPTQATCFPSYLKWHNSTSEGDGAGAVYHRPTTPMYN